MTLRPSTLGFAMAATCAALTCPPAAAGSETGQITALRTRSSDNLVFFNLNGVPTGKPACARYAYWMIKDENSATGRRQFAMLMSAAMAGKTVTVSGTGACTRWGDGEDVEEVVLHP